MLPFLPLLLLSIAKSQPSNETAAAPLLAAAPAGSGKLTFILAGQSNMAGRGGVSGDRWDHVVPPECRPSPSILRLSSGLRWEPAHEPLHADVDLHKTCGVGPGMAFANAVRSWEGAAAGEIRLVPCAAGGTAIRRWEKGAELYERMVARARAAGGRAAAVLWYQGESDTVAKADAEAYGARMQRLVRDLREDLGDPELLVIQVALASGEGSFIDIVREAQKRIDLPNVVCVDAKGLPLQSDHLHLTTQAQVQLGKMLAAAYLSHVSSSHQP